MVDIKPNQTKPVFLSVRVFGLLSSSLWVFFHNVLAAASSGLPQVSPVHLGIEMIHPWTPCLINSQTLKTISEVESFLCPDKQETPEEGRRIRWPKRCEKKTIKIHTIVQKLLLIKIIKLRLRNLDKKPVFVLQTITCFQVTNDFRHSWKIITSSNKSIYKKNQLYIFKYFYLILIIWTQGLGVSQLLKQSCSLSDLSCWFYFLSLFRLLQYKI